MDALTPNLTSLQGRNVVLPGGHDNEGRPLIVVYIQQDCPAFNIKTPLQYLLAIFSETTLCRGVTVVIDTRKGPWKVGRMYLRQVKAIFSSEDHNQILVLRPESFLDKQRVENCTNAETNVIFTSRLNKFVDQSQLPIELGGNYLYNHKKWLEHRQKVDEFYKNIELVQGNLNEINQILSACELRTPILESTLSTTASMAENTQILIETIFDSGQKLIELIEQTNRNRKLKSESNLGLVTSQETIDTINKIDNLINSTKTQQTQIEETWIKMQKMLIDIKDLCLLKEGVVKVTNWILGPAENLFNAKHQVGFDVASAEELRREHENIELQCWNTYGAYAELLHKIKMFPKIDGNQYNDLISQKDFMNFVCRSFALRLEKRRNVLITSLRFFRLVSEYFDKTGEVFGLLIMEEKLNDFALAETKLMHLNDSQIKLERIEKSVFKEGEKLSDMLSMSVKDALGRDILTDYSDDIVNIRDILDATTARKNIFNDSVELQKLTLEQMSHINNYENDTIQAISWLNDLFKVLVNEHGHVGCTVDEIQSQKNEHQTIQETAKDTYNYGLQLLHASLQLRQSCKLSFKKYDELEKDLNALWKRLFTVSQEQMTRLRVSAVFHRTAEEHCNQMRDLRESVATIPFIDLMKKKARVQYYFGVREQLMIEVGRIVRLGRLLRARLKESLYENELISTLPIDLTSNEELSTPTPCINEIAIEAISERLSEVTSLAEELDQALFSAQQDCSILSASSFETHFAVMDSERPKSDAKSDDEFVTASESTLQHSRSSSYNTASECENRYSPWWDYDRSNINEDLSKEKMVLAVGLPNLPPVAEVLKPSPEVPPGKIAREVTETTHIKVQHQHTLGVASYVLTSERVCEKNVRFVNDYGKEVDDLEKKIEKVSPFEEEALRIYPARQAVKGFI